MGLMIKETIDQNVADMIKRFAPPAAQAPPQAAPEPIAEPARTKEVEAPQKSFFGRLFAKIFG